MWRKIEDSLPEDYQIISIDLLGFGDSPKPRGASYNVRLQARSVAYTLLRLKHRGRVVLIGHSMGSLISIEIAKRYPLLVQALILASPPIYRSSEQRRTILQQDELLRRAYRKANRVVENNPQKSVLIATRLAKNKFVPGAFSLTEPTLQPYLKAMQASIIDQSAYSDVATLKVPVKIIYGSFDPFVVGGNLRRLNKISPYISLKRILAFHDVSELYRRPIIKSLAEIYPE